MQLEQALARYLLQLEADGRSVHTRAQYARHVRALARWLADQMRSDELKEIDADTLARFLVSPAARDSVRGGAKKATSVNSLRTSLKVFFGWWHAEGEITKNPARMIRRAHCGSPPPRALSDDEVHRLLGVLAVAQGATSRRDHMLVALMLRSGVRLGSALALDKADVDLERGEIMLRCMKGDRVERVFFGRELREHFIRFLRDRPDGPLFTRPDGRRVGARQAQRRVEQWMRLGSIRGGSAHSLRHTFGSRLYARTRDVLLVQRAMTHRTIASTLVYAVVDDASLREAVRA